jgi:hypothetical protein
LDFGGAAVYEANVVVLTGLLAVVVDTTTELPLRLKQQNSVTRQLTEAANWIPLQTVAIWLGSTHVPFETEGFVTGEQPAVVAEGPWVA